MDVFLLNGSTVRVRAEQGLDVAKEKVAKALKALPLAVVLSRGGEVVTELVEDGEPLFAVVDPRRLQLAEHWQSFQEKLPRVKEQRCLVGKLGDKLGTERRFGFRSQIAETSSKLRFGTVSLKEEERLVVHLSQLQASQATFEKFEDEYGELDSRRRLLFQAGTEQKRELQRKLSQTGPEHEFLVQEFEQMLNSCMKENHYNRFARSASFSSSCYWSEYDYGYYDFFYDSRYESLDDGLESMCPRLRQVPSRGRKFHGRRVSQKSAHRPARARKTRSRDLAADFTIR
ncbi:unnamed protein product [Symbiodinium sp. CCMP2592]|nr:unnamed protein product [Symbiodinium sp. CCMP2592]